MAEHAPTTAGESAAAPAGLPGVVADWSGDKQAFPVPWGKAMMWIFLLSDNFICTCFLTSYMNVRISTTVPWPNPSEVLSIDIGGAHIPVMMIAFFFQAEDGIRDYKVTGVQTCALPISADGLAGAGEPVRCQPEHGSRPPGEGPAPHQGVGPGGGRLRQARRHRPGTRAARLTRRAAPGSFHRSEERRVGKECGARWSS